MSGDPGRDALEEAMEALRVEYAQRLDGDLLRVARAVEALASALDDKDAKEKARFEVHRLKGSAGTFGFNAVTARAADLEELVVAAGRPSSTRSPQELAEAMRRALAELLAAR